MRITAPNASTLPGVWLHGIGSARRTPHDTKRIMRLLDNSGHNGARASDMTLAYLRRIFNQHALRSDTFRSPIVRGMARYNQSEHKRSRVLDDNELAALWRATKAGRPFDAFIRFLLLTGCRKGEANGLVWDEITDNVWDLPAARNKTKQPLTRPLSAAALAIVTSRPHIGDGPLVFSANGFRQLDDGEAPPRRRRWFRGLVATRSRKRTGRCRNMVT